MPEGGEDNKLQVTEFISAAELASLMDVSATDVVAKCFSLGMMVSINQRLDAEVIELVAGEFGFEVEFIDMEKQAEMEEEDDEDGSRAGGGEDPGGAGGFLEHKRIKPQNHFFFTFLLGTSMPLAGKKWLLVDGS